VRDAPASFAGFRIGEKTRTPTQILAHIGDLFDWALHLARGKHVWNDSVPLDWDREIARFFATLRAFDDYLAGDAPLGHPAGALFQGPVADALNHIGQINMLRRLAGSPVKGESYLKAEIVVGRVGPEQSAPRREFD
jgi:hypothetical protein